MNGRPHKMLVIVNKTHRMAAILKQVVNKICYREIHTHIHEMPNALIKTMNSLLTTQYETKTSFFGARYFNANMDREDI